MRINSLACTPLCPAEVDKHDWSRSDTSPRGKKRKAARSASLCRGARVKLVLCSGNPPKKAHDQINESQKKHNNFQVYHFIQCNSTSLVDIKTPPLALATLHHSAATTQVGGSISWKQLPNKAALRQAHFTCFPATPTHARAHKPSSLHVTNVCQTPQDVLFFGLPLGLVCWRYPIGNLRSRPLIAVVL